MNDLRVTRINKLCIKTGKTIPRNVDMASLPPCRRTLEQHVRRANYQVAVWKAAGEAKPAIPSPDQDHGWIMAEEGLQPMWYEGDSLPENLQDVSEDQESHEESDDSDTESDSEDAVSSESDSDTDSEWD